MCTRSNQVAEHLDKACNIMLILHYLQNTQSNRKKCQGELKKLEIIMLKTEEIPTLTMQISMINTSLTDFLSFS